MVFLQFVNIDNSNAGSINKFLNVIISINSYEAFILLYTNTSLVDEFEK